MVDKTDNPAIEEESHDLPIGVGIKDLRKVFKVCNISHNFKGFSESLVAL